MINSFIAVDLETTGLSAASDKIIEIGAVKVLEGEAVSEYSALINPGVNISKKVSELTGITDDMVIDSPFIGDIIGEFISYTENLPLLGHNVIFDYGFLKKAAVNHRLSFEKSGIDTLKIARRVLPQLEHKNLDYLCRYFGIDPMHSHRALDDAKSSIAIYYKLNELNQNDKGFFEPGPLNYAVKRDTPITAAQKSYLSKLVLYHNLVLQTNITELTRSQASRIIDSIIVQYGKIS